ncbi:MAG TPA: spermidine/putrescine ABC transporter substrate-binding protein [Jatrophihabitans sp.]|jgi:spermidine/putrescine transport system substrate-binding protein|nr:spermidine/putrescine ABC transporter substrate-binding protein [Jatrophihabitans sp.]
MHDNPNNLPPDFVRGLAQPRLTRRGFLQAGGLAALTAGLAACGVSGAKTGPTGSAATKAAKSFWQQQKKTGSFTFANWPLYIDKAHGTHPSLDLFTKQTGIDVSYKEVINDNAAFFGKIQPELQAGNSAGYDLMVITNGFELDKLKELNYLIALDQDRMTNFNANASDLVKNPSFDPGNQFTMAWQSGMTGIGYDPAKVGHKITSWQDLKDPKLKGKIGMFSDNQDLPSCALLAVGVNPEDSTEDDWNKAANWLKDQQPLVRKYYDQSYIDALGRGDVYASMAWSGDIYQANLGGGNLEFVIPDEGAVIWTDNMCIPAHAEHALDAMIYMDYVYQPKIAAMLAEWINYITPVDGVQAIIKQDAAKATGGDRASLNYLADSVLIFPSSDEFAKLHRYRVLTTDEENTWNDIFEPIYQA